MSVDYGLAGRVAIVTGASRIAGIGAAVVQSFAAKGASVFTTYYRPYDSSIGVPAASDEPETILEQARARGVIASGMDIDLAEPGAAQAVFEKAVAAIGPVDILINNAAHDEEIDIYHVSAEQLDRHFAVNARAAALLSAEFARRHDGRPGGRIVNLTSGQGLHPMPENLPYAVSKGALEALTLCLSASLAPRGITVNAVDPGGTDTGWMSEAVRSHLLAASPLGRIGTPEDAARIVLFLASEQAGWITGQIIHSRGGL